MHEQGSEACSRFRRHGTSEGDLTTFGYFEWHDAQAAVRYAVDERGEKGPIILWGISMGAATALLTAAQETDVDAVIAESSFYAAAETLRSDLSRMFGLPRVPFGFPDRPYDSRRASKIASLDLGQIVSALQDTAVLSWRNGTAACCPK